MGDLWETAACRQYRGYSRRHGLDGSIRMACLRFRRERNETVVISVERESEELPPPYESCCFCDRPTPFWDTTKDVPVCPCCAEARQPEEVPSKEQWVRGEKETE